MTEPSSSITWSGTVSGVDGGSLGYAMCWNGVDYVPASAANRILYTDVVAVLKTVPDSLNRAELQHTGPLPRSITGFGATDTGWAIVGTSGALTFSASQPSGSDYVVGRVILGLTHLTLETENTLSLVTAVAAESGRINVVDYGADPTGVADSTAEIQAAINAMSEGYTLYFPAGVYLISDTLNLQLRAFRVEGAGTRTSSGIFSTEVRYTKANRNGLLGSLTNMFVGTYDLTYTWTGFNYLKLTGATGLVAGDKGKRIRIGEAGTSLGSGYAARSYWNAIGVIVQIDSSSQCIVAMPQSANDPTTAGDTDANNGSIRWEILEPIWRVRGRDGTFEGFSSTTSGGATTRPSAHFETTYSPGGSVATHFRFNGLYVGSADGVSIARAGTDQGCDFLPSVSNPRYTIEGTYERPFVPYQNDYNFYEYSLFQWLDVAHTTGNPTGQCRGNDSTACGYNFIGSIVGNTSRFLNPADQIADPGGGSMAIDIRGASGGAFTSDYAIDVVRPNAGISVIQSYFENTFPGLARSRYGTIATYPISFSQCYFVVYTNTAGLQWINWTNGPFSATDCTFIFEVGCTGMTWNLIDQSVAAPAKGVLTRCLIPSATDIGGELLTIAGGATTGAWFKKDCREFILSTQECHWIPDVAVTNGLTTQAGYHLQRIHSLSQSWVTNNNFVGTATVTGAATTAVWTFGTAEASATKLYGWAVPIASTGVPAAGSNRVVTCVVTTTTATVTVEVAPGVGTSVTFAIIIARGI